MSVYKDTIEEIRSLLNRLASESRRLSEIRYSLSKELVYAGKEVKAGYDKLARVQRDFEKEKEEFEHRKEVFENLCDDFCAESRSVAKVYADFLYTRAKEDIEYLRNKSHPALSSAEKVRQYAKENKKLILKIKEYEYEQLNEWAEVDEQEEAKIESFEMADEDEDTTKYFISEEEYDKYSESERNQLALDRFLRKNLCKSWVGRLYEMQIGYMYEGLGYKVEYRGMLMGKLDGGIDLICRKDNEILYIQCKCWSRSKVIYEKYIMQLYGAAKYWDKDSNSDLFSEAIPVFVCTTELDKRAMTIAKCLGVIVRCVEGPRKDFPMIKCNIGRGGERIYHLPFDQQYRTAKIDSGRGEFYALTVREAEEAGFRRAFRWTGTQTI